MNNPQQQSLPLSPQQQQPIKFFKKREKIYPRAVSGRYRRLKWIAMIVTLGIYYLAPFIRWDRGPNAPDQAILIDLYNIRAYWFFVEIWPQEIYYIAAVLIASAVGLFFVTALLGRVWCGYFCPQTVWTDLFMAVERLVQGDRAAQQRLDKMPLCFEKIWKKIVTHAIWVLIALATAGAFVFYFNDAPTLWHQVLTLSVSDTVLFFVAGLTFSTYLMAGFAREQVCTYMCPYARFQSAMFDRDTLIIGYDVGRGEPRGKHKKGDDWTGKGHCVDCTACVQVCPMGIDIRHGLQMECIACGLCVDACNNVMDKVDLPRGLIRYDTESNIAAHKRTRIGTIRVFRPRSVYYMFILLFVGLIVVHAMMTRLPYELHVLHSRNPLFVQLSGGDIRNGYDVKILNKTHAAAVFALYTNGIDEARIVAEGAGDIRTDALMVPADSVGTFKIFVLAPAQEQSSKPIKFIAETGDHSVSMDSMFISKGK